jgi:hypothetical protein
MRIPVCKLMSPLGWTWCSFDKIRPTSLVRVAKTSTLKETSRSDWIGVVGAYFARVNNPTLFSGFDLVLEWQTRFTASC